MILNIVILAEAIKLIDKYGDVDGSAYNDLSIGIN